MPAASPLPAARWRRALARTVDVVVAPVAPTTALLFAGADVATAWFVGLLLASAHDVVPVARTGTTLGKGLLGIRVVGPDGRAPGWARAILRFAVVSPFLAGLPAAAIGFLRPARRGLHDRVAMTAVVTGPSGPLLPVPGTVPRPPVGGGDVVAAVFAGVWLSALVTLPLAAFDVTAGPGIVFGVLLPAQDLGGVAVLVAAWRCKGTTSWQTDVGWAVRLRDARFLLLGPLLHLANLLLVGPILVALDQDEPAQEVSRELGAIVHPGIAVVAVVVVAVVGPVLEEVLFRGVVLRALLRRMSQSRAIAADGGLFALVHLLDPGSWPLLPGLFLLGYVLARITVSSGTLSRAIYAHAGFNLVAVLFSLAG